MTVETGVNGFGRIGMLYTRAAVDSIGELSVQAINTGGGELNPSDIADRLSFDSTHRGFAGHDVSFDESSVLVDGNPIALFAAQTPEEIDWAQVGDNPVVIESTGQYVTTQAALRHLTSGAKKVVITAPAKDEETTTIVRGVNDSEKNIHEAGDVVAVSSCSTNCIAPVLRVLSQSLELVWAKADVVHAFTNSQRVLDGRGEDVVSRRNFDNILPASTGSSREVSRFFPDLPFHSNSFRVPTPDGSIAVITAEALGAVTEDEVMDMLKAAAELQNLKGVIGFMDADMYSEKVIGESYSAVIDASRVRTRTLAGRTTIELQAWFDNEWGYANRVAEVAKMVGSLI